MRSVASVLGVVVGLVIIVAGFLLAFGIPLAFVNLTPPATCGGLNSPNPLSTISAFNYSLPANSTIVSVMLHNCVATQGIASLVVWNTVIGWGDGTNTTLAAATSSTPITHVYGAPGNYVISDALTAGTGPSKVTTTVTSPSLKVPSPTVLSGGVKSGTAPGNGTTTGPPTPQYYISPSFTYNESGLLITVRDTSVGHNESVQSVSWTFGDGSASVASTPGGLASHTYGRSGTYTVTEFVTGGQFPPGIAPGVKPGTYNASYAITVSSTTTTSSSNSYPPASTALSFSLFAVLLIVSGAFIAIGSLVAISTVKFGGLTVGIGVVFFVLAIAVQFGL